MSCHLLLQKVSAGYISGRQCLEPEKDLPECMTIFPKVISGILIQATLHVGQREIALHNKINRLLNYNVWHNETWI